MKNRNEIISGILFITIILVFVSNVKVFISYVEQQEIINDIKYMVPKLSLERAESFNYEYPTLNVFTQPLKNYLGRVYLREGMYDKAIETFHKARSENPYLLINENFLADVYRNLKMDDSVKYYSRKAFNKMPNNVFHYEGFLQTINIDDTLSIDESFDKIILKSESIWIAYLAGTVRFKVKSDKMKSNIEFARINYYKNPTIRLLINYHLYGKEKVDEAVDLIEQGSSLMNARQHYESIFPFLKAYEILPKNNDLLLNLASSYYIIDKFEEAKKYIDQIEEDYIVDNGKYFFIKGIIYCENNFNEIGCKLLTDAIKQNFNDAYNAKLKYCK